MADEFARRGGFAPDHAWDDARQWLRDCRYAIIFLTRLPLGPETALPAPMLASAMRAFPLAGLLIGLVVGAVLALALWVGAPPSLAALLAVAAGLGLTGALHEDGLADVA